MLRKLDRALMDIVKSEAKSESLGEQEAYTGGSPDESDKDKSAPASLSKISIN